MRCGTAVAKYSDSNGNQGEEAMNTVDTNAVESKVKDMYERVAHDPHGDFHFEMGRALAD